MNEKKGCFKKFLQNNPEMMEYNSKNEQEVKIIKTYENKILEDVTQLTISENNSSDNMIISAPVLKNK